jgi:penicillin-binding protein 1C
MNLRRLLAVTALAATGLAAGGLALDRLFPPDLSRYHERSSETVDANGRLLRAFTTADGKWRLKTTVDDVDPVYLALLKAYEDRRFDDHWGIDPLAAARAAGQWIARGRIVSGASTISMQAARLLEPRPRGLLTKVIQSARALQLEWRYSKREVLAIYLTLAPMGGNLEGVRAASFAYFGKEPRQLSAAEAALLVAIPQSPERRRPERAGKSAQAARDRVLVRGLEHGIIDRVLFDKAAGRPVPDRRLAMPMQAPHLAAWLAGQSPGAIVPTTLRFELQSALSQLVVEERGQFADRAQIAVVAIDNRSGAVVAWLGGSDFFGRAGQVDLVRSRRSPGSALKPLIYAMAFDDRVLHPESLIEDVPVRFRDWLPRNFDRDHVGAVTVRRALQQSLNVPAVLALEKVGPQRFISTLRNAGVVPGLPPGEAGATLGVALGSATVSPLEMAGLYAGLANGGKFAPPTVRRDRPRPQPVQLIGPTATWYVGDVLAGAPLPDGFAPLANHNLISFKSHQDSFDAWSLLELIGYYVNYRKQASSSPNPLPPENEFRVFAISSRFPDGLASQFTLEEVQPGVYDIPIGPLRIRLLVIRLLAVTFI